MTGSRPFIALFRKFILRRLADERLRSAVTILGIALGIGVVIAIQLTNISSVRGFEAAVETISGKTSLEIIGAGPGFDEVKAADLGWLRAYGNVSPVIEGDAFVTFPNRRGESLHVLGVDILSDQPFREYNLLETGDRQKQPSTKEFLFLLIDPQSIVLTEKFARTHGLDVGSTITMTAGDRVSQYTVRALLRAEGPARAMDGNVALMDIAAAQLAFNRIGRLDRLDVRLFDTVSIDAAEPEVRARLPEGLSVQRPSRRGRQVEKMLEAFHFNLTALSYIALVVGLFLIYNTVSTSVITRREEIGTLRALGVTRRAVLGLFLAEAAGLATLGSTLGIGLGQVLAEGAVRITSTTVNALYIASAATTPAVSWNQIALAFLVGVPLSLLAAAIPALEAARVAPTAAIRGSDRLETRFRLNPRYIIIPLALFVLGWWLSTLDPIGSLPLPGYGASVAIVFGAAFLVPAVLYGIGRFGDRPIARVFKIEGKLAMANLMGAIPRISISVAALAVSLSMMVAIAVMVGSFRETVIYWVGQTLRADLYIRPATRSNVATDATLSDDVLRTVSANPNVEAADPFRIFDVAYEDGLVSLGVSEFAEQLQRQKLLFKRPSDGARVLSESAGQPAVIVSESFAIKHRKKIGDRITLPTPVGDAEFSIVAEYYDYSNDRGVIIMDRPVFVRYFGEPQPTNLAVYLKPGADPDRVRDEILSSLGDQYRVFVFTNVSLKSEVLRIFDSTFKITYALEVIAIFVAILGVASTLLTLILERRRELAMLRLVGADHRQVRKMVVIEAALIGGASQGIGIVVGLLLSLVLIYVVNVQSFGWTIQFHVPYGFLAQSSVLILVATAISGIYPARRATAMSAPEQATEE